MYENGQGVPQDYAEAVRWYRLAAEQGYAAAQNSLGVMNEKGWGVLQDYAEAVSWYRLAAEQGYALAHYNLGLMSEYGSASSIALDRPIFAGIAVAAVLVFASVGPRLLQALQDARLFLITTAMVLLGAFGYSVLSLALLPASLFIGLEISRHFSRWGRHRESPSG